MTPPRSTRSLPLCTLIAGQTNVRRLMSAAVMALSLGLAAGCDQLEDVIDDNKSKLDLPIETEQVTAVPLDLGAAAGAAAGQPAPQDVSQPIPIPPVDLDLNKQSPELAKHKGAIKRLEFTGITVTPLTNTVTSALPTIEIWVGPMGGKDTKGASKIATIPSIPAGSTAAVQAAIDVAGTDAAQAHLLALAFSQVTVANLVVKKGEKLPSGAANLQLKMKLKATLNPL